MPLLQKGGEAHQAKNKKETSAQMDDEVPMNSIFFFILKRDAYPINISSIAPRGYGAKSEVNLEILNITVLNYIWTESHLVFLNTRPGSVILEKTY